MSLQTLHLAPATYRLYWLFTACPGSTGSQFMWDLRWTKWHWGMFSRCRLLRFLLPILILLNAEFVSFGDGTMGPPAGQSTKGLSLIPP
jgi:hypothetical protein